MSKVGTSVEDHLFNLAAPDGKQNPDGLDISGLKVTINRKGEVWISLWNTKNDNSSFRVPDIHAFADAVDTACEAVDFVSDTTVDGALDFVGSPVSPI